MFLGRKKSRPVVAACGLVKLPGQIADPRQNARPWPTSGVCGEAFAKRRNVCDYKPRGTKTYEPSPVTG